MSTFQKKYHEMDFEKLFDDIEFSVVQNLKDSFSRLSTTALFQDWLSISEFKQKLL